MAEIQYASNGKGNLGVTLGAIGTGLGALAGAGGLGALLGVSQQQNADPNEKPVSRYEMSLISENTLLKANQYADQRAAGLQQQLGAQAVWNATQEGVLRCQAQQLAQLFGMTRLTIPNANISPGWGPVDVYPNPAAASTPTSGSAA